MDQRVRLIDFPIVHDPRGNLSYIEGEHQIPFPIRRVYYLYDVPGGAVRGGHAHRDLQQVLIALSGSFDVVLDDGTERLKVSLNRSWHGLLVPNMVWRELENFSSGAVCLVLASEFFQESDYIRDHALFLREATAT
ncbi:MAG TPA: FdtA/QdtA family cupin domain-containing protein [Fibrobacteria bacterium]|nr:FdtA/QdtA family cupin domain-containing protein [Fibrobacteria bacterium]